VTLPQSSAEVESPARAESTAELREVKEIAVMVDDAVRLSMVGGAISFELAGLYPSWRSNSSMRATVWSSTKRSTSRIPRKSLLETVFDPDDCLPNRLVS
jgi:hypothetical protein